MTISQREARRLKKRVTELEAILEAQRSLWSSKWPGGVNFWTITGCLPDRMAAVRTARALGHAVVVVETGTDALQLFALPLGEP